MATLAEATSERGRLWLKQLAAQVLARLRTRSLTYFHPGKAPRVARPPFTTGWVAELGNVKLPHFREVCIYLDNSSGHDEAHLWAGLFVVGQTNMRRVATGLQRHLGPHVTLRARDFVVRQGDTIKRHRLSSHQFDRPVLELWDVRFQDFGQYFGTSPTLNAQPSQALVRRVEHFLAEVLAAVEPIPRIAPKVALLKAGTISRRALIRSSAQAQEAKVRDSFTCRVCFECPEDKYGVEGRVCLEAHHLDRVAAPQGRYSRLARVVTVCANCHRVLGRLPEGERGLSALQKRFRAQVVV